jgi:hypothetical protein
MKKLFLILSVVALFGCKPKDKPPEDIMSKQEMVSFLIDLHIIEAKISVARFPNDSVKVIFPQIEEELFAKHNISDSIYFKSYQYYLNDMFAMEEIYTAVVDSLSLRERLLNQK